MHSFRCGALVGALLAFSPLVASASERADGLSIQSDPLLNAATLSIEGTGNTLQIVQDSPLAATRTNSIDLRVAGEGNGAGTGLAAPLIDGLPWGSLAQVGEGNEMSFTVVGDANLLAALQTGNDNTLVAEIAGTQNQAAVFQAGAGNMASLAQAGIGNLVSISQTSW